MKENYKLVGLTYIWIYFLKCFNDYYTNNNIIFKLYTNKFDKIFNVILCIVTIYLLLNKWTEYKWIFYLFIIFLIIDCYMDSFVDIEKNVLKNNFQSDIINTIHLFFGGTNYLLLFIILYNSKYFFK